MVPVRGNSRKMSRSSKGPGTSGSHSKLCVASCNTSLAAHTLLLSMVTKAAVPLFLHHHEAPPIIRSKVFSSYLQGEWFFDGSLFSGVCMHT